MSASPGDLSSPNAFNDQSSHQEQQQQHSNDLSIAPNAVAEYEDSNSKQQQQHSNDLSIAPNTVAEDSNSNAKQQQHSNDLSTAPNAVAEYEDSNAKQQQQHSNDLSTAPNAVVEYEDSNAKQQQHSNDLSTAPNNVAEYEDANAKQQQHSNDLSIAPNAVAEYEDSNANAKQQQHSNDLSTAPNAVAEYEDSNSKQQQQHSDDLSTAPNAVAECEDSNAKQQQHPGEAAEDREASPLQASKATASSQKVSNRSPQIVLKLYLRNFIGYIIYANCQRNLIMFHMKCDLLHKLKIETTVDVKSCHFFYNGVPLDNFMSVDNLFKISTKTKVKLNVYFENNDFKFSTESMKSKYRANKRKSQALTDSVKQFRQRRLKDEHGLNYFDSQAPSIQRLTTNANNRIKSDYLNNNLDGRNITILNRIIHLSLSFPYLRDRTNNGPTIELFDNHDTRSEILHAIQDIENQRREQQQQQESQVSRWHQMAQRMRSIILSNVMVITLRNYIQNVQLLQYNEGIRIFVDALWQLFLILLLLNFWNSPLFICIIGMSFMHFIIHTVVFNMRRARIENENRRGRNEPLNLNIPIHNNFGAANDQVTNAHHFIMNEPNPQIAALLVGVKKFFQILVDFFSSLLPDPLPIADD